MSTTNLNAKSISPPEQPCACTSGSIRPTLQVVSGVHNGSGGLKQSALRLHAASETWPHCKEVLPPKQGLQPGTAAGSALNGDQHHHYKSMLHLVFGGVAVHKLLLAERHQLARLDLVDALDGACG